MVIHVFVTESKVVEVQEALGEKVILALGTARLCEVPPAVKEMLPLVKSMVTPLLGTLFALKLALNQMKLPAGTGVPLKFEEFVAVATHGGGGGGPGQLGGFVKVMVAEPSATVTVPDTESGPVNAPTPAVTVPVKLPLESVLIVIVPEDATPFIVTL